MLRLITILLLAATIGCSAGFESQKAQGDFAFETGQSDAEFVFMSLSTVAGFIDNSFSLSNFTVSFDAVPSQNNADIVIGLSQNAAGTYSDLAAIVRFNPNGQIDVRNGGLYSAATAVSYSANQTYRFEMTVDVPARKYSVKVTPAGQAAVVLAQNYSFRNEQSNVTSLGNIGASGNPGSVKVSKISITINLPDMTSGPSPTPTPTPTPTPSPTPVPAGTPQYPSLLKNYKVRPAFKVAGVDYYVGVPGGITLKNPGTISMAGVSVNAGARLITITGGNVTLDGYDFSGWAVVTNAANTRLINSKFNGLNPGGPQTSVISGTTSSSNLYVGYSTIDGLSGGGRAEFLVEMEGPGLTIEYSWLKNSNSDLIGRHGVSGGDIRIQYNLTEQAGMGGPATHGDYLQVYGPNVEATYILYNTTVQVGGITQGFICDNTKTGEIAGNVFTGGMNYFVSTSGPNTKPGAFTSPFRIHDNYWDPSNVNGLYYPAPGPVFTNNVNMVTGGN